MGRLEMKALRLVLAASTLLAAAVQVAGAGYPEKPVRLVVPFPPGGGVDAVARLVAQKLQSSLGQGVIVENMGGAGGVIAAEAVAKAKPDGYTLLVGTESTHGTNSIRPLRYDPVQQFAPITLLAISPSLLVAKPSVPASTLPELLRYAKDHPNKLNFGSWGNGSSTHLAFELLKAMSGAEISHIPYKGGAAAMTALIAGEIDLSFQAFTIAMPHLKSGRAKVIAVGGSKRFALLPEVPTISEAGIPGYKMQTWYAVFAPAGTPQAVIDLLQPEIAQVLAQPDVREKLLGWGMEVVGSTPEELRAIVANEVDKWKKLVREWNLSFE